MLAYYAPIIRNNSYLILNTDDVQQNILLKENSNSLNELRRDYQFWKVHTTHQAYTNNTIINNPEWFKEGFTVAPGKELALDIALPVSGNINLQESGILKLNNDLMLDSRAYLTAGGVLQGERHALLLTSSFVVPENKIVKITSDIIIDGQGNNIVMTSGSKFIIDSAVSVTIKNCNWCADAGASILEMRADTAQLTLDSVIMAFDTNFAVTQGELFMRNDVVAVGPYEYAWNSIKPLYVLPFSTLRFDVGSTFSYSPNPTGPHTALQRDLVRLVDDSSQLYFDNCIVCAPDYGMQLTRGMVLFDNKVTVWGNLVNSDEAHSIEFGDGVDAAHDVEIKILSGANVELNGYLYHHPAV